MASVRVDLLLLRKAARAGSTTIVRRMLAKLGPHELAMIIAELPPAELKFVIELLLATRDRVIQLVQAIPDELLHELSEPLGPSLLARVLAAVDPDDAKRVAQALEPEQRERALDQLEPRKRTQIDNLLRYPPESAAGRMIPRFVSVAPEATVGEAIRTVRQAGPDVPLFYLYVVDDAGRLLGVLSLGQLVKATDETAIRELMATHLITVAPQADQEEVARTVSRRNLLAVPVVQDDRLIGLVTIDDVIDVLEQEATEDMYNMAGLSEGDRVFSPPHRSLFKRLPWNALNLLTSMLAATVVAQFEGTIARLVALATFMPIVAGIGGNTGNQTLTVIIRGITLGELEFSSAIRALVKELAVGLSIGAILGCITALLAYAWKGNPMLGLVLALAILANLFVAALVGTAIPLTLKRLGLDPALGGSILVTMCTDVFGFLSFLGLATLLLM
jgi:magnesium transporter